MSRTVPSSPRPDAGHILLSQTEWVVILKKDKRNIFTEKYSCGEDGMPSRGTARTSTLDYTPVH